MIEHPGILQPGSVIGLLGGGQLARMLVLAGHPLGFKFMVLDPDPEAPAAQVGAEHPIDPVVNAPSQSDGSTYPVSAGKPVHALGVHTSAAPHDSVRL